MAGAEKPLDKQALLYCERGVELLTDLLSQLPTRRFVHTLLEDKAVLIKCKLSALHSHPQGALRLPSSPSWVLNPPASECCVVMEPYILRATPDCIIDRYCNDRVQVPCLIYPALHTLGPSH